MHSRLAADHCGKACLSVTLFSLRGEIHGISCGFVDNQAMSANEAQSSISIRDIESIPEMREVEMLQTEIWGVADREIFPAMALIPMLDVGGVLIGAFDGGRIIGFVFGFPGYEQRRTGSSGAASEQRRLILHSDMLAVRPEYRSHGLGYQLKLAQRDRALAKGID